jgi:hypothetical protein
MPRPETAREGEGVSGVNKGDEDADDDRNDDRPYHPSSRTRSGIQRRDVHRAGDSLPREASAAPSLTAPTRGGWMPDQVRHDGRKRSTVVKMAAKRNAAVTPVTAGTEAAIPSTLILGLVPGIQRRDVHRAGDSMETMTAVLSEGKFSRRADARRLDPRDKPEDEGRHGAQRRRRAISPLAGENGISVSWREAASARNSKRGGQGHALRTAPLT